VLVVLHLLRQFTIQIATVSTYLLKGYLLGLTLIPLVFCDQVLPLSGLRVLDLTNCLQLDASCFHGIAQHLGTLEVLLLKELPNLDDEGLAAIVASCKRLKVVDVSGCPRLTGAAVTALGVHCKHLRMCTLAFLKFTGQELAHLLMEAGAASLHTFSLRDCHLVTTLGNVSVDHHLPPPPPLGLSARRGAHMSSTPINMGNRSGSSNGSSSNSSSCSGGGDDGFFFSKGGSASNVADVNAAVGKDYDNDDDFSGAASPSSSSSSVEAMAAGGFNGGFGSDSASGSSSSSGSLAPVLMPQALPAAKLPFAPLTCINLSGCHNLVDR